MMELLIIGGTLGAGILLVVHGTIFKTRWGINLSSPIECPGCHRVHGQIRTLAAFDKHYGVATPVIDVA